MVKIKNIYRNLQRKHGNQDWWPILELKKSRNSEEKIIRKKISVFNEKNMFEVCLGAILTQNTAWGNVEKAMINIKREKLLSPEKIINYSINKLKRLIKPSGYYNQKAKKLKIFSKWLMDGYHGSLKRFFKTPIKRAREELLKIHGIGPETADSILLFAGQKPSFVIDSYTRRLCRTYGIIFKTYEKYQRYFESRLPKSAKLFNEYHALIVAWGKDNKNERGGEPLSRGSTGRKEGED